MIIGVTVGLETGLGWDENWCFQGYCFRGAGGGICLREWLAWLNWLLIYAMPILPLFWCEIVASRDVSFTIGELDIEIMPDTAAMLGLEWMRT